MYKKLANISQIGVAFHVCTNLELKNSGMIPIKERKPTKPFKTHVCME